MWVYDGEQWTEEGETNQSPSKSEQREQLPYEMFLPELQVVEVTTTVPKTRHVPVPLP